MSTLTPVLALIVWTFVMWFWLYATRIPAMRAIGMGKFQRKDDLKQLPVAVQNIADNYNHLHEQPTLFYALAIYSHLVGMADPFNVALAWIYVGIRIVHSLVQCTSNFIPLRFMIFAAGSLTLMIMTVRNVIALFPPAVLQ
jgi:hypothetical protein